MDSIYPHIEYSIQHDFRHICNSSTSLVTCTVVFLIRLQDYRPYMLSMSMLSGRSPLTVRQFLRRQKSKTGYAITEFSLSFFTVV